MSSLYPTLCYVPRVGLYTPRVDEKRTETTDAIKQQQQPQQQPQQHQQQQQEERCQQEDSNKENNMPQPQGPTVGEDRVGDCSGENGVKDNTPQIIPWRAQLRKTNSTLSLLEWSNAQSRTALECNIYLLTAVELCVRVRGRLPYRFLHIGPPIYIC